jgi:hypothetical protein
MTEKEGDILDVLADLKQLIRDKMTTKRPKQDRQAVKRPPVLVEKIYAWVKENVRIMIDAFKYNYAHDRRMFWKDVWFFFSCFGFIVFCFYIAAHVKDLSQPYFRYPDGTVVSGNCESIQKAWDEYNRRIQQYDVGVEPLNDTSFRMLKDKSLQPEKYTQIIGNKCPTQVCTCPSPTTQSCETTICPSCPVCTTDTTIKQECSTMDAATKEKLLNLRPPESVPAVQDGFFEAKKEMLDILKLKPLSPYWEGHARGTDKNYYDTVIGAKNASDFIFVAQDGSDFGMTGAFRHKGFFLSADMWMWNNTPISWEESNLTYWTDADNHTWVKNTTWIVTNASNNLWVERR